MPEESHLAVAVTGGDGKKCRRFVFSSVMVSNEYLGSGGNPHAVPTTTAFPTSLWHLGIPHPNAMSK